MEADNEKDHFLFLVVGLCEVERDLEVLRSGGGALQINELCNLLQEVRTMKFREQFFEFFVVPIDFVVIDLLVSVSFLTCHSNKFVNNFLAQ